ncbi:5013_t:CDS:1, partial [Scutellospora calospora]
MNFLTQSQSRLPFTPLPIPQATQRDDNTNFHFDGLNGLNFNFTDCK